MQTKPGIILILLILFQATLKAQDGENAAVAEVWYSVTRVVDGDTFWIDDGSEKGLENPSYRNRCSGTQEQRKEINWLFRQRVVGLSETDA